MVFWVFVTGGWAISKKGPVTGAQRIARSRELATMVFMESDDLSGIARVAGQVRGLWVCASGRPGRARALDLGATHGCSLFAKPSFLDVGKV